MTTTATKTQIGQRLKNGATVLQVRPDPRGDDKNPTVVVLALWTTESSTNLWAEFVTWVAFEDTGEAFWGHYHHHDLDTAMADFKER